MTSGMTLLAQVRGLVRTASEVYRGTPAAEVLTTTAARLDEPLRVAIAGRVKAGKSTLLNALVGQELAATDAAECTRIVTWYRDGTNYRLTMYPRSGPPCQLPFPRSGAATRVPLNGLEPQDVERLVVDWPSAALRKMTLIDTPGLGSVNIELSDYTVTLLAPEGDGASTADAVIYLMRHLHGLDVRFLEAFHDEPGQRRPFNTVGILARADEIGHGRLDSLDSAARIAARYRGDFRVRQLCQTVIPVSGLLAATSATLRETEYRALTLIAAAPHDEAERLLISADRLAAAPTTIELLPVERVGLLERFGMFGIRLATELIRAGKVSGAADMSRVLLQHSGLTELRELLMTRFAARADVLKSRSALLALDSVVRRFPKPEAAQVIRTLEEIRAGAHEFAEITLLDALRTDMRGTDMRGLPAEELDGAERLLGGAGIDDRSRLGLDPAAPDSAVIEAVHEALTHWQRTAETMSASRDVREAARVLVRTCEGILFGQLAAQYHSSSDGTLLRSGRDEP